MVWAEQLIVSAYHPDDGAVGRDGRTSPWAGHVRSPKPEIVRLVVNPRGVENARLARDSAENVDEADQFYGGSIGANSPAAGNACGIPPRGLHRGGVTAVIRGRVNSHPI